jgi:hypothetical protein
MVLEEFDTTMGTIPFFNDLFIQVGYVTLFVSAFPLVSFRGSAANQPSLSLYCWQAPLLAYISNWVEIKSGGYQLLYMYQRPLPVGSHSVSGVK